MRVEDAVRLVLASASLPQDGCSIYVRDMGEPVRILDLAIDMIEKAGLRPFADIEIQFVGVRPGEKLHEGLHYPSENYGIPPWTAYERLRCPTTLAPV
jgi:FlaA1/EpsC-like NDP-sugar epimerase